MSEISPIQRLHDPDWATQMHDFIDSRVGTPYEWGSNDCCMFVCDHLKAITGVDVGEEFRGRYNDEPTALAAIRDVTGGVTVEDAAVYVCAKYGMPELPSPKMAGRGDVVLLDDEHGMSLGCVYLNGIDCCFVGVNGLYKVPLANCRRAWRVN